MGIYPEESYQSFNNGKSLTKVIETPGLKQELVYELILTVETRTNCFCCSCGDREGSDPFCRNHGWLAHRPCELHEMPGQLHRPEDEGDLQDSFTPFIPESVQKYRGY